MKRSFLAARAALRSVFFQRCFYLFLTLLAFIAIVPFLVNTQRSALITHLIDTFIIFSVVAAVGRSLLSFVVVVCLALPAAALHWLSVESDQVGYFDLSLKLHAFVYSIAIALLLRYTFDRKVVTTDRLWGAADAYLMIGILWSFFYTIVERGSPMSFSVRGEIVPVKLADLIYFSFSTLTTTGFGDIVPVTHLGRVAAMLEGVAGQLFIAILIAKLVSVYPRPQRKPAARPTHATHS